MQVYRANNLTSSRRSITISPVKTSANYDLFLYFLLHQQPFCSTGISLDMYTNFKSILNMHVLLICINGFVLSI